MKAVMLLVPLILSIGLLPAFGETKELLIWIEDRNGETIYHEFFTYNCQLKGNGNMVVNLFPEYVHLQFSSQGNQHQRIFDYVDYNTDIIPYYQNYIGVPFEEC